MPHNIYHVRGTNKLELGRKANQAVGRVQGAAAKPFGVIGSVQKEVASVQRAATTLATVPGQVAGNIQQVRGQIDRIPGQVEGVGRELRGGLARLGTEIEALTGLRLRKRPKSGKSAAEIQETTLTNGTYDSITLLDVDPLIEDGLREVLHIQVTPETMTEDITARVNAFFPIGAQVASLHHTSTNKQISFQLRFYPDGRGPDRAIEPWESGKWLQRRMYSTDAGTYPQLVFRFGSMFPPTLRWSIIKCQPVSKGFSVMDPALGKGNVQLFPKFVDIDIELQLVGPADYGVQSSFFVRDRVAKIPEPPPLSNSFESLENKFYPDSLFA